MSRKTHKTPARLPRGFVDRQAETIRASEEIMASIRQTYELYGFEPLETPLIEYSEALGKFLPDADRPNEGVFSLIDDDEQWLSLRYDLTAPLARYVAENFDILPKPYRSYRAGWVFRNEKPGPGRFRQFMQFDADVVATASPLADAEMCMMAADALDGLGIERNDYVIRVNNRKILDGIMALIGLEEQNDACAATKLTVLRAIDKLDKFGLSGVELLLGAGRLDESGDFTPGAGLDKTAISHLLDFLASGTDGNTASLENLSRLVARHVGGSQGVAQLQEMQALFASSGYEDRIKIDPSVVRGLEYYTGPVFEAELLFDVTNEAGDKVVFGSVGGGGRYDGLVSRFRNAPVPATGFSIGVSRLMSALTSLGRFSKNTRTGPVMVLVMDHDEASMASYQKICMDLRAANIRAELYIGSSSLKAQMKYADRRGAPCVIIQGEREREADHVEIKDLIEGKRLSGEIEDNRIWREMRPAQVSVSRNELVTTVQEILSRQQGQRI